MRNFLIVPVFALATLALAQQAPSSKPATAPFTTPTLNDLKLEVAQLKLDNAQLAARLQVVSRQEALFENALGYTDEDSAALKNIKSAQDELAASQQAVSKDATAKKK